MHPEVLGMDMFLIQIEKKYDIKENFSKTEERCVCP